LRHARLVPPAAAIPQVVIGSDKVFAFDHVFGQRSSQRQVFDACVAALLDSFCDGFNSTVMGYGQTGSGKTHTVGTGAATASAAEEEEQGIIPRVVARLFATIADRRAAQPGYCADVRVSFLEIYGDDVRDLLNPAASGRSLAIRETEAGVAVQGAAERRCEGAADMLGALEEGSACRATASTEMNAHSSRSHAVFTIVLDQQIPYSTEAGPADGAAAGADAAGGLAASAAAAPSDAVEHRVSKFHLLDLAGSERAKRTQATGKRLQEGININLGLLALGNVISALGDEEKRRRGAHVPYRDSKLTRLLQDSLGGNCE
jgi:hypothetical protein